MCLEEFDVEHSLNTNFLTYIKVCLGNKKNFNVQRNNSSNCVRVCEFSSNSQVRETVNQLYKSIFSIANSLLTCRGCLGFVFVFTCLFCV